MRAGIPCRSGSPAACTRWRGATRAPLLRPHIRRASSLRMQRSGLPSSRAPDRRKRARPVARPSAANQRARPFRRLDGGASGDRGRDAASRCALRGRGERRAQPRSRPLFLPARRDDDWSGWLARRTRAGLDGELAALRRGDRRAAARRRPRPARRQGAGRPGAPHRLCHLDERIRRRAPVQERVDRDVRPVEGCETLAGARYGTRGTPLTLPAMSLPIGDPRSASFAEPRRDPTHQAVVLVASTCRRRRRRSRARSTARSLGISSGRVLEIVVDRHDELAPRGADPGEQCVVLTVVPHQVECRGHVGSLRGDEQLEPAAQLPSRLPSFTSTSSWLVAAHAAETRETSWRASPRC